MVSSQVTTNTFYHTFIQESVDLNKKNCVHILYNVCMLGIILFAVYTVHFGQSKYYTDYGVESMFVFFQNALWYGS